MKNKILRIGIWSLSIVLFIALVVFVVERYNRNKCSQVKISIVAPPDCIFISEQEVKSYVASSGDSLVNSSLSKINIQKLESKINQNPFVFSSKVYTSIDGTVNIDIIQRVPIARIQNLSNQSFYITNEGHLMPIIQGKTARVVFANGFIPDIYWNTVCLAVDSAQAAVDSSKSYKSLKAVYQISKYINKDAFWKAQIQQLYMNPNGDIELIPSVGKHIIIFGDEKNIPEKFDKLKIFYKKAEFINAWDKYDTINISYKGQVICS